MVEIMSEIVSPSKEQVLIQLERVLESKDFKGSARLSDFLEYIVLKTLDGEADHIKGYTIGVEAFGKDADFDPDTDASVRVEASRLRKALTLYYHEAGRDDPVVIHVPKGRYKPHFIYTNAPPILVRQATSKSSLLTYFYGMRRLRVPALIVSLVLLLFVLWPSVSAYIQNNDNKNVMATAPFSPVVAILPFNSIGSSETREWSDKFVLSLTDKLTAFDSLNAVSGASVSGYEDWNKPSSESGANIDAQYVIEGTIREHLDQLTVAVQLLDLDNNTYIWSYEKSHSLNETTLGALEKRLTDFISAGLGSPYGIIQSFEHARMKNETGRAAEAYKCVLSVYRYANNQSVEGHRATRECLEKSVEKYPQYVEAWSLLAYLYIEEVTLGYNRRDFGEPAAERAMKAAQRAVEIDPRSARAHQNMAEVAKLYGDEALLRRHTKASLLLNPNDSEVLANAAWSYGELGEWNKAKMHADKAVLLNLGHPRWYHGILYSYSYQKGRYKDALMHALHYFQDGHLYSNIALVTSYAGLYQIEKAQEVLSALYVRFPDFKEDPQAMLDDLGFEEDYIFKLQVGLRAAGVQFE